MALKEKQREETSLREVIENIKNREKYLLHEDCLYMCCNGKWKICLPTSSITRIINECHTVYGHSGARKCQLIINEDLHYPNLYKVAKGMIKRCDICQKNKMSTQARYAPLQPIIMTTPLEVIFVDYYGPLPASRFGFRYVFAVLDGFIKYVKLYGVEKQTTQAAIAKIFGNFIPQHGKPGRFVSQHGTQFTSKSWKDRLKKEGIEQTLTSLRHPQSSMIKRENRELCKNFRILLQENKHFA